MLHGPPASPRAARRAAALCLLLAAPAHAQVLLGPAQVTVLSPPSTVSFDAADVNGDGRADLVMASLGAVSLRLSDGTGLFAAPVAIDVDVNAQMVNVVDLDGDGRDDVLATSISPPLLSVTLAIGDGVFGTPTLLPLTGTNLSAIGVANADVDLDGDADVMAVTYGSTPSMPGEARLFLNDGAGGLSVGLIVAGDATHVLRGASPVVLNGDAFPDVLVVTSSGTAITTTAYVGLPEGGLQATWSEEGMSPACVADIDLDGDMDLLMSDFALLEPVSVSARIGAGDGSFTPGPTTNFGLTLVLFGFASFDLVDLDGDGWRDLVTWIPGAPQVRILRGNGTGAFPGPGTHVSLAPAMFTQHTSRGPVADFDGDGRPDISGHVSATFQSKLVVTLNRTYAPGGPLLDLGGQLLGGTGWPIQLVEGSFVGGEPFSFSLFHGPSSGNVFHVIGLSVINAPFKGGTMVPMPDALTGPWPTSPGGTLVLAGNWLTGVPQGIELALQFWFSSPGAVKGLAASSGVLVTTP